MSAAASSSRQLALPVDERLPALFPIAAPLGEQRYGIGAGARERPLDSAALSSASCSASVRSRSSARENRRRGDGCAAPASRAVGGDQRERRQGEPRGRDRRRELGLECEHDPGRHGAEPEHDRREAGDARREPAGRGGAERGGDDQDGDREGDRESGGEHPGILAPVDLGAELERIAAIAAGFAADGERVSGVLPAEPEAGARIYLCAFERGAQRSWLALDGGGEPVLSRARVREAVSIAALCELAERVPAGATSPSCARNSSRCG